MAFLVAASAPAGAAELRVAVAANVQYAFDDLRAAFKKETGHDAVPAYGSSGKFTAQIMNGAPFDVFMSADMAYPERLYREGHATHAPKPYAYGALVLWTLKEFDLTDWQAVLAAPSVKRIAVANPKTAPYGRESINVLTHYQLKDKLQSKLVFGESIAQTNQYIHTQAADVGFTSKAAVLAPQASGQGKWIDLPRNAYQPIAQGAVVLRYGQQNNPQLARQFHAFLYSESARRIFGRYGYLLP